MNNHSLTLMEKLKKAKEKLVNVLGSIDEHLGGSADLSRTISEISDEVKIDDFVEGSDVKKEIQDHVITYKEVLNEIKTELDKVKNKTKKTIKKQISHGLDNIGDIFSDPIDEVESDQDDSITTTTMTQTFLESLKEYIFEHNVLMVVGLVIFTSLGILIFANAVRFWSLKSHDEDTESLLYNGDYEMS